MNSWTLSRRLHLIKWARGGEIESLLVRDMISPAEGPDLRNFASGSLLACTDHVDQAAGRAFTIRFRAWQEPLTPLGGVTCKAPLALLTRHSWKKSNQLQKSVTNVIVYSQPDRKKGHFHFYTFLNTLDEQVELNWKVKVLNWQRCDPARLPSPPNLAMLENWSKIFSTTLKTQVYNSRRGLVMCG